MNDCGAGIFAPRHFSVSVLPVALLLFALCSCSARSPREALDEGRKQARSWQASARFVATEWTAGSVPSAFERELGDSVVPTGARTR